MGGGDDMGGTGGGSGMGGGARGGGMGAGGGTQRRATKAEQLADKLKLNKEQREEASTILSAAFERAGSVRAELDKQRAQLAGAYIDGKTGDDLNKLMDDYTAAAVQMTKLEADAFGKIYALLKPNQQSKSVEAFELMAGMFNPPAAGRGAGGRGGTGSGMGRGRGNR